MISIVDIVRNPDVTQGIDLADLIQHGLSLYMPIEDKDVLVVTSNLISIIQGNVVQFDSEIQKLKIIKAESYRVLRDDGQNIISTSEDGYVLYNAGIKTLTQDTLLLPLKQPDKAAHSLRQALRNRFEIDTPILISCDSYSPFRSEPQKIIIGMSGVDCANGSLDKIAGVSALNTSEDTYNVVLVRGVSSLKYGHTRANELSRKKNLFQ